jgi:hypothetical protein
VRAGGNSKKKQDARAHHRDGYDREEGSEQQAEGRKTAYLKLDISDLKI